MALFSCFGTFRLHYMGHVKRKSTYEHAQNVRINITLRMRKVLFGSLLFIITFCSIQ